MSSCNTLYHCFSLSLTYFLYVIFQGICSSSLSGFSLLWVLSAIYSSWVGSDFFSVFVNEAEDFRDKYFV